MYCSCRKLFSTILQNVQILYLYPQTKTLYTTEIIRSENKLYLTVSDLRPSRKVHMRKSALFPAPVKVCSVDQHVSVSEHCQGKAMSNKSYCTSKRDACLCWIRTLNGILQVVPWEKDIRALNSANTIPIVADPQNIVRKCPTAAKNAWTELLSPCASPIWRMVLNTKTINRVGHKKNTHTQFAESGHQGIPGQQQKYHYSSIAPPPPPPPPHPKGAWMEIFFYSGSAEKRKETCFQPVQYLYLDLSHVGHKTSQCIALGVKLTKTEVNKKKSTLSHISKERGGGGGFIEKKSGFWVG